MEGRKILQWGLTGVGIAIVISYSCFVLYDFVRGPRIIISSPKSGYSTTSPVISIIGQAIHANNITINDYQTAVDLAGNFSTRLILAPGYNIIRVTAEDNYNRIAEETAEIVLVVPEQSTATTSLELTGQSSTEMSAGTSTPLDLMTE